MFSHNPASLKGIPRATDMFLYPFSNLIDIKLKCYPSLETEEPFLTVLGPEFQLKAFADTWYSVMWGGHGTST